MHWAKKRELTPEEVKKLPSETEVHLEGRDRHGELTWLEGHIVQSGKKKVFAYRSQDWTRESIAIKAYPNKKWMVQA